MFNDLCLLRFYTKTIFMTTVRQEQTMPSFLTNARASNWNQLWYGRITRYLLIEIR